MFETTAKRMEISQMDGNSSWTNVISWLTHSMLHVDYLRGVTYLMILVTMDLIMNNCH